MRIISNVWIFILALSGTMTACSGQSPANANRDLTTAPRDTSAWLADHGKKEGAELTKIYSLAIADYIKAVKDEYKISFDTLFFGKRVNGQADDFPDITLPDVIERTQIRLISPETGLKKQKERKSMFYINLVGWVDDEKAGFIFVTFSNGFEHQFDCFLDYTWQAGTKTFQLEQRRFVNYRYKKQ